MIKTQTRTLKQSADGSAVLSVSGRDYAITPEMLDAGLMIMQHLARSGTIETAEYLLAQEAPGGEASITYRATGDSRRVSPALLHEVMEETHFLSFASENAAITKGKNPLTTYEAED